MNNNLGVTTTFFNLLQNPGLSVKIPIIQRDYAQGRLDSTELLKNFLQNIKKHLDESRNLNLDFVYGSIQDECFIPIDGQQRLTTLFLLHWYLAIKSNNKEHLVSYLDKNGSRFTYETRISSKDFCNKLISENFQLKNQVSIVKFIKEQHWFYLNWINDPTITAMLNALEIIESIFDNPSKYYGLLVDPNINLITFEYIRLEDFGLTDQLYIKMNSRGKPLTDFENFKANIESVFEVYDNKTKSNLTTWFTNKIDGVWCDLMWNFLDKKADLVDSLFMNFIRASLANQYALSSKYKEESLKDLIDSDKIFNYYIAESIGVNTVVYFENVFNELDAFIENGKLSTLLGNNDIISEETLFKDALNDKLTLPTRIQLYAYVRFRINNYNPDKIGEWMRIIRNLTENSRIDTNETFIDCLNTVTSLLKYSELINEHIIKKGFRIFKGFSDYQSEEEYVKAILLINSNEWSQRIRQIENHKYLKGQIRFLLEFSGVYQHVLENKNNLDFDKQKDFFGKFDQYVELFNATFQENGIREYPDFLFERALLSIGDYTLKKSRNHSFLINGFERDISWKRFLRHEHNMYLKELFDSIEIGNVEKSLKRITNNFKDKKDFRYHFVVMPEIIQILGREKYIRFYSEDEIYLLTKTQMNGKHYEYYTYALQIYLEKQGYEISYFPNCVEEWQSKYIDGINGKTFYISYFPDEFEQIGNKKGGFIIKNKSEKELFRSESLDKIIDWIKNNIKIKS